MVRQLRVFGPRAALGWIRAHGKASALCVPNRRHQPRSVIVLTACPARSRASHPWTSLASPKVAARHQSTVNVAVSVAGAWARSSDFPDGDDVPEVQRGEERLRGDTCWS